MSPIKTLNCYKTLRLEKETATVNDVKKAYRKLALQFHPDKQPLDATDEQKQKANEAFQNLGIAYSVLSDPKRKERYDKTGSIDENEFEGDKDWNAYFKELWTGVVSTETIDAQKLKYQGSKEEEEDVLESYKKYKGNMDSILQVIECSSAIDGERFEKLIRKAIKAKTVPEFKKFETTTTSKAHQNRIKAEQKIEAEFEKQSKQKEEVAPSLLELIQQRSKDRQANMNSIIESIENSAKKNEGKGKRRKQEADSMPTDEEFEKLQKKLFKKSKN